VRSVSEALMFDKFTGSSQHYRYFNQ